MSTASIVLTTIGLIVLIKSLFVFFFPSKTINLAKIFTKNKARLRNTAVVYLILALILLAIAYYI